MLTFTDKDIVDCYLHKDGVALTAEGKHYGQSSTIEVTTILTKQELQQLIKYIEDGEDE